MSNNLSKTYKETAEEWLKTAPMTDNGPLEFAAYLDGFTHLDDKFQILAYQKVREMDRELITLLVAELPKEKVEEIAKIINDKHLHRKNAKEIGVVEETTKGTSESEAGEEGQDVVGKDN